MPYFSRIELISQIPLKLDQLVPKDILGRHTRGTNRDIFFPGTFCAFSGLNTVLAGKSATSFFFKLQGCSTPQNVANFMVSKESKVVLI